MLAERHERSHERREGLHERGKGLHKVNEVSFAGFNSGTKYVFRSRRKLRQVERKEKRKMLVQFGRVILAGTIITMFASPLFAQGGSGNTGDSGGGYTGGGNTGSGSGSSGGGYTGGSSSSTGSSSSSSSSSGDVATDTTTPLGTIELQEFDTQRSTFIGINTSVKFVGTDEIFDSTSSTSTARRTTTSTTRTSATRRTNTANRSTSQSSNRITNAGRAIASSATFEPNYGEPTINNSQPIAASRLPEIKAKLLRLPSLKLNAERLDISVVGTSSGVVAELRGVVATERESKILKQLLLLEPGIDRVKNELKIEPPVN
ncbi:MAG: hypothetical protein LBT09_04425 [Planctomycetaceae bacterium]|nr:hypothetical protein [Planctomycetaceae bacterium]